MAKRFMFVCAGLLCLVLAFQVGALTAAAQVGGQFEGMCFSYGLPTLSVNRMVYLIEGQGYAPKLMSTLPVLGSSPIVATAYGANEVQVMTEDGKVWASSGTVWSLWADFGTLGPVPAKQSSWGSVKLRYK